MKKIKEITILEIPETLEGGSAKIVCEKPYRIERTEEGGEIMWFGYNTNWKKTKNKWYKLIDMDFKECGKPEYEELYERLGNQY